LPKSQLRPLGLSLTALKLTCKGEQPETLSAEIFSGLLPFAKPQEAENTRQAHRNDLISGKFMCE